MKTKKANFCMQAATLAQSYTSLSSSKQFSETFLEPSAYCLHQLTFGGLWWELSLFYVEVGWKNKALKPFVKKVTATRRHPTKHGNNHR